MSRLNSDAEIANAATRPPTNVGTRNSDRSNIGSRWSDSAIAKPSSRITAAASDPSTCAEPQPASFERISPKTSSARPALKVTKPIQSRRRGCGSLVSGTARSVTSSATIPTGRFTKKIQRHDRPVVIAPPSTGPTATATPVIAPKTPKATPRSAPR